MCRTTLVLLGLASLCLGLPGCSRNKPLQVTGQVTWEGKPLEQGIITFRPANLKGPTAEAPIVKGSYTVEIAPGEKRVSIQGFQVVGKRRASPLDPGSPEVEDKRQILPVKYSDKEKTELSRTIEPGATKLDFDLKP